MSGTKCWGSGMSVVCPSFSICIFTKLVPFSKVMPSSRFTSWSTSKFSWVMDSRPEIRFSIFTLNDALLELPAGSVTVRVRVPSWSMVYQLLMTLPLKASFTVQVSPLLSLHEATILLPTYSRLSLTRTCFGSVMLTSVRINLRLGGVVSFVSVLSSDPSDPHDVSAVVRVHAETQKAVAMNAATNVFPIE